MKYQELHQRYGSHIAKRVQAELGPAELNQVILEDLLPYLEMRMEAAHKEYQAQTRNPLGNKESRGMRTTMMDMLHKRWRSAEEIANLVSVAEDVSVNNGLRLTAS